MAISSVVAGFVFAFLTGWLMTVVILATVPALAITGFIFMKIIGKKEEIKKASYYQAAGYSEQAISSIKTVKQLNGEKFEKVKYKDCLEKAMKTTFKYRLLSGFGLGSIIFILLASYSLGFWYGSKCINGD